MTKFSITDKLIVTSFLLSGITIFIVAAFSFINAKNAILDRAFNQLNSVRAIKINMLNNFFSNRIKDLNLLKTSTDINYILRQINSNSQQNTYTFTQAQENKFLHELNKEYYSNILIIGKNKNIHSVNSNPKKYNNKFYEILWNKTIKANKFYINDFEKTNNKSYTNLTISSKITDSKGNISGIIVLQIPKNAIDTIMLNKTPANGLGKTGESYLVGYDYLMRSQSRFIKNSFLQTKVKTPAVDSAFAGKPGIKVINDYRNIKVLSSYSKLNLPNLKWVILAEIDYSEVTTPIYKIRTKILFISIFIFLIVLIIIIVFSRNITYPIQKLTEAAKKVGQGNFNIKVKLNTYSNDEISELGKTFNQMISQIKAQNKEIDKQKYISLRSLIDGQENERARLSREIHDSLGQLLIALKLKYENNISLKKQQKNNDDLSLLFDKIIEETRRISNNLMPVALSQFGLKTAVRNICNDITEISKLNINLNIEGTEKNIDPTTKIYIFRIIQESLTNILKHSNAKNSHINIVFTQNDIKITITDDGIGFDCNKIKKSKSNGLNNIKNRINLLKGSINIKTKLNHGTKITVIIPLKNTNNE